VALSEDVLQQALRYNMTLPVPYIIITNGAHTMGWKKEGAQLQFLTEIPIHQ
jgi:hypothetical protein